MGSIALQRIAARLDIIEALNARVMLRADNLQALALADQHGILCAAGSDAHHGAEIGRVHADMPPFTNAASLLRSLAQATLGGRESHPIVHANSTYARVVKQLTRWQKE